jgi:hypothetical protein
MARTDDSHAPLVWLCPHSLINIFLKAEKVSCQDTFTSIKETYLPKLHTYHMGMSIYTQIQTDFSKAEEP